MRAKIDLRIAANIWLAMQAKIYKWVFRYLLRNWKWTAPTLLSSAHVLVKLLKSWRNSEHELLTRFAH
jgi:hypothetical protein